MQALFIGQTYIDVTFLTDRMPTGDEKHAMNPPTMDGLPSGQCRKTSRAAYHG